MDTIYNGLYGAYQKSAIDMREAAYANIGIATNEDAELEFVYVGPENLGTLISISTLVPPSSPVLNDRYYIPAISGSPAMGDWAGHEGEMCVCISETPLVWAYREIKDTSYAVIANTPMAAAVTYESLPSLALWRAYDNSSPSRNGTFTEVIDIIDELPAALADGDSYLVCNNPTDPLLAGKEGQVATYVQWSNTLEFETINKVFLGRNYEIADAPSVTSSIGDRYIISDAPTEPAWSGHAREIAEATSSGWKFLQLFCAEPEETDKLQSTVAMYYASPTQLERIEYKKQYVFVKDVTWTSDLNALFVAYAHRSAQFKDIISIAEPNLSADKQSLEPIVIFYPIGRGSYYNTIHVDMRLGKRSIHEEKDINRTLLLDIYETTGGNKIKTETFEVSFNPKAKDLSGNSIFIEDIVNTYSNVLRVAVNRDTLLGDIESEYPTYTTTLHSDIETLFVRYLMRHSAGGRALPPSLEHGDDGSIYDSNGHLNWETATSLLVRAYTGQIVNPDAVDPGNPYETSILDRNAYIFDLVFDAGYPRDVKNAILTLSDARYNDCFGVLDLGDNSSSKAAYEARTMEGGTGTGFNSPFVALYEPFSLVYDAYMGRDLWISPVFHAARAFALTDKQFGRHYAPAGATRGSCPSIKKLRYNLDQDNAYKDFFVTYNINPIIFNNRGYNIWGQSTSYLKTSKFQDINVIRMVMKIRRDLENALQDFIFELNEPITWNLMSSAIDSYLGQLVSNQALNTFKTQIYASDYDVTQHRVRVDIMLDPKMVLYQILMQISV
jgi:hypothetical protein